MGFLERGEEDGSTDSKHTRELDQPCPEGRLGEVGENGVRRHDVERGLAELQRRQRLAHREGPVRHGGRTERDTRWIEVDADEVAVLTVAQEEAVDPTPAAAEVEHSSDRVGGDIPRSQGSAHVRVEETGFVHRSESARPNEAALDLRRRERWGREAVEQALASEELDPLVVGQRQRGSECRHQSSLRPKTIGAASTSVANA